MKPELKKFLISCPLAIFSVLVPSFLGSNTILSILLLLIIAALMLAGDWNRKNLIYYMAVAVSGPLAESIAIHFGVWTYAQPLIIGVPLWLPFLWGNAGLYILRLKSFIDS